MEPTWIDSLATWKHDAKGKPVARLLLIHGICEHSGRHLNTISALNNIGVEVVRFDLRGSGRSGGKKQYIDKWSDYLEDTTKIHHWICRTLPPLPLFVLGHSMGGAIAISFAHRYQRLMKGLILSAPAYLTGGAISELKVKIGRALSSLLPSLRIPGGDDRDAISRDPSAVNEYWADPLSYHFNTVRQGKEVLDGLAKVNDLCQEIFLPTYLVHGTHDRLIKLEGSFEIIRSLKGYDKVLHIIPGGYHEPHNDLDKEEYFTQLTKWIEIQLRQPMTIAAEKTTQLQEQPQAITIEE